MASRREFVSPSLRSIPSCSFPRLLSSRAFVDYYCILHIQ